MANAPSRTVLHTYFPARRPFICRSCRHHLTSRRFGLPYLLRGQTRTLHTQSKTTTTSPSPPVPFRKQLKEEAKARKLAGDRKSEKFSEPPDQHVEKWELTVGIEIHVELNTERKLFSQALTSLNNVPNTHVSAFDAALPGSQPQFQSETLIPALRAAIAFSCDIKRKSSWDRKHYFWWDQPNGYQITQYYEPFAVNGHITLYPHDDIDMADSPDAEPITIGIKQIQMEQDTAKTVLQPPTTHLLDFNRVSHPLIEIITLPQLHSAKTAAALVKKVQSVLKAVGANTTGMEMGGLRADVNVSVRRRPRSDDENGQEGVGQVGLGLEYGGVTGLGQRTEIKNLNSFKAVEDAIVAEKNRQIEVLEAGGFVEGETRGWTLGRRGTRRIRGKEGEIDYRYMPDPDLGAVMIGEDLVQHVKDTLPQLPDELLSILTANTQSGGYDLTTKDAKTLMSLDDGDRLEDYLEVVWLLRNEVYGHLNPGELVMDQIGKLAANWILHEIPHLLHTISISDSSTIPLSDFSKITPRTLAYILSPLLTNEITTPSAKHLLRVCASTSASTSSTSPIPSVNTLIEDLHLRLKPMSDAEYSQLAQRVINENSEVVKKTRAEWERSGRRRDRVRGKIMWFVGRMVAGGEKGRVQPERAEGAVWKGLGFVPVDGEGHVGDARPDEEGKRGRF